MYKNIIDPITKKKFNIHSNKGLKIIKKYLQNGGKKIDVEINFGEKRLKATENAKIISSNPPQSEVGTQIFENTKEDERIRLYYKKLSRHEYDQIKDKDLINKWRDILIESEPVDFCSDEYKKFGIEEQIIYIKEVNHTLDEVVKQGRTEDLEYIHFNIKRLYTDLLNLLYNQKLIYLDIKLENIGVIDDIHENNKWNNRWIFIDNESTIASEHEIFPVPIYFRQFYHIIPYDGIEESGFKIDNFYEKHIIPYDGIEESGFKIDKFYEKHNIKDDFKIKSLYILLLLVIFVEIYTGNRKECKLSTKYYVYVKHYTDIFTKYPELKFWKDIFNIFLDIDTNSDDKWKSIVEQFEIYFHIPPYRITTTSDSEPVKDPSRDNVRSRSPVESDKRRSASPPHRRKGRSPSPPHRRKGRSPSPPHRR